jgi:hypothetical protein
MLSPGLFVFCGWFFFCLTIAQHSMRPLSSGGGVHFPVFLILLLDFGRLFAFAKGSGRHSCPAWSNHNNNNIALF